MFMQAYLCYSVMIDRLADNRQQTFGLEDTRNRTNGQKLSLDPSFLFRVGDHTFNIGTARIFSGVHFFLKKVDLFHTQAKTAKLTTRALQMSPAEQKCP